MLGRKLVPNVAVGARSETSHEAIMDLLAMTPYFWNIDLKTKARVEAIDRLALDVDVEIRVFKKQGFEAIPQTDETKLES